MSGIKLGFSFVDLAKAHGKGIGSIRLKDGSSIKILGSSDNKAVDLYRIKHNKLLEAKGYRGEYAVCEAANDVGYIAENLAVNSEDALKAWGRCFDTTI